MFFLSRFSIFSKFRIIKLSVIISFLSFSNLTWSEVLLDTDGVGMHWIHADNFATRDEAFAQCAIFVATYYPPGGPGTCSLSGIIDSPVLMAWAGWFQRGSTGVFDAATYYFNKCQTGGSYNVSTDQCGSDEQKGAPPIQSCVGNPINIAIGNKFQQETDYSAVVVGAPEFSRSYNSLDGLWRHNYSSFIRFAVGKLSLVHADGRESFFTVDGDKATAYPNETGTLVKTGATWIYTTSGNERFTYNATGELIEMSDAAGQVQKLAYDNGQITVTAGNGRTLTFTEDAKHQPLSLAAPDMQIAYTYDARQHLTRLVRTRGSETEQRSFHYEDTRNLSLLTGITDERGVRFATWTYDDKGRAISSQHSGAAGLTQVAYNADGSSTVTNELGKTTVYRFQQIGGVKRVTSIEGEPSPNCPASNSSYTYNDRGQAMTKTDAKGLVTAYTYNDRGLQTSRTEASGTPLARTVTTEWDATRFLPVRIVEPDRTTVYSYDAQGRELSRHTTSR